jgi:hypothetical protein
MKKAFWIAPIVFVVAGLSCNLPLGLSDNGSVIESLPDANSETFSVAARDALLEMEELSGAQRQVLAVKGTPNRFTILFSDSMREETWYYDHLAYEVTFRNGDVFTEGGSAVADTSMVAFSDYAPWEFNGSMGLSELLAVSGSESFAIEPLDEVFEGDASLVYMDGLDAGFRNDRLVFIRAIPLSLSNQDFPVEDGLTPAEAIHQGPHTYQVYCEYSDGLIDEYSDTKTWSFEEDGVNIDGLEYIPKIAENRYGFDDEDGEYVIIFNEDIVTLTGGFFEEEESGSMVYITFVCVMTLDE